MEEIEEGSWTNSLFFEHFASFSFLLLWDPTRGKRIYINFKKNLFKNFRYYAENPVNKEMLYIFTRYREV